MNNWNPLGLRIDIRGRITDKYGRVHEFNDRVFRKKRKTHAHPAYAAHNPTGRLACR